MLRSPVPSTRCLAVVACLAALAGCHAVGPDYVAPEFGVPASFESARGADGVVSGEAQLVGWWRQLGDPLLDELVAQAVAGNLELREALSRIDESRAVLGIALGGRLPDFDATSAVERSKISGELFPDLPGVGSTETTYSVGVESSWEVDVFGRVRRDIEAAGADFAATIDDYRDVLTVLQAEVAAAYVDVRTFQTRLRYAAANVETQRGSVVLTQARFEAGVVAELDVAQARRNLATTESIVPTLEEGLAASIHRISVLLGLEPRAMWERLTAQAPIPTPPDEIAAGIPADLLRRRPDLRAAERRLAAATARVGVTTAELYPQFTLHGSLTRQAFEAGQLSDGGASGWSLGPRMRWNLFDGDRVRNAIEVRDAQTERALVRYENTLLTALEEVENAFVAYDREQARRLVLQRAVDASQEAADLSRTRYVNGLVDFQDVLDSERALAEQEDNMATSEGLVSRNVIRLFRALGGGWVP